MATEKKCLLLGCESQLVWRLHEICPDVRVERAESVEQGARFLAEGGFDHLVLDSRVPQSLEFLEKLATLPQFHQLKRAVCMDRRFNQPHVVHHVLSLRVTRIFYFPIEAREVAREIASGLKLKTPAAPLFLPPRAGLKERAIRPLLNQFQEVSRTRAVRVMVDFPASIHNPELRRDLEREAHKLKGSLGSFGFPRGSELARELETLLRSGQAQDHQVTALCRDILKELESESEALIAQDAEMPVVLVISSDHDLSVDLASAATKMNIRTLVLNSVPDTKEVVLSASITAALVDLGPDPRGGLQLIRFLARGHVSRIVALAPEGDIPILMDAAGSGAWKVADRSTPPEQLFALAKPLSMEGGRLRVLAVDDDPVFLSLLKASLESLGLTTLGLSEPEKFWEQLEAWSPDMLVLDVDMPAISGIELCRAVRASSRWGELPIVVITSRDDAETKFRVFRAGADDYITKPFVEPELRQRIANKLGRSRVERDIAEKDALTGLLTRRKAVNLLRRFLHVAAQKQVPVSIAVLDLDRFKLVNDTHGHAAGDGVLKTCAKLIAAGLRTSDVVARWGGEEIVLGMYGMARESTASRLRQVLSSLQATEFPGAHGSTFRTSFSAGVSQFPDDGADLETLLDQADAALYRAKQEGRARVYLSTVAQKVRRLDLALVEDDQSLAEVVQEACESRCFGIATFTNGSALLEAMTAEEPLRVDLLVLDYDLPDLDGLTLLRRLKEKGLTPKVIMVSGKMGEAEILEALDLGVLECLQKPVYLSVLMRRIEGALKA